MSANLRTVAQIPARVKYLVAAAAGTSGSDPLTADDTFAFSCAEGVITSSLISSAALPAGTTNESYAVGDLFKDLGRQVTIYDDTSKLHLVTYRQVQRINGAGSEGVATTYGTAFFVRVWAASGAGVRVARTGPGAH